LLNLKKINDLTSQRDLFYYDDFVLFDFTSGNRHIRPMANKTKQWLSKPQARSSWHRLAVTEGDNGERWTIVWDTERRPGVEGRSVAREKLQTGALDCARHMRRMGFIVYEIRHPSGEVYLAEDALQERLSSAVAVP
jgi:hypothetical protein